ncbi:hypothetical protein EDD18DRAFT_644796 [Armillaria luteobubalina]|uniref:Uncharacterized protein n=1 Tax=Armillaria luteobubalina TaxID=153913 RepID=A0AA39ULP2_9AGAR|nr:hypothetical protein EDD18DRAFT_644796 [Armillaria luteobubalina]
MAATKTHSRTSAPELTDSQIKDIFVNRDIQLNRVILAALLYGIYTGIVAVTLWAVASRNPDQDYRRPHFLVFIILLLYIMAIFDIYYEWAGDVLHFITKGTNFWDGYNSALAPPIQLTSDISAILSTNLADATLIWRCWIVWDRSWRVVLVPIACTIMATVSRGIVTYYTTFAPITSIPPQAIYLENIVNWAVLYSSVILATLLWCTIFIVYRILRVGGAAAMKGVYRRVIEMLVESALLYSAVIVVLLVFEVRNQGAAAYVEELAIAMRSIAPTILVGRVAAGHARPDDSWSQSTTSSSFRFRSISSLQNDRERSVGSGWDTPSESGPDIEEGFEGNMQSSD